MPSNILAFAPRRSAQSRRTVPAPVATRSNVIELAAWVGRAIPHRTPNGVFFTTQVLATPGEIA